jgi:hypothetical protein
MSIKKYTNVEGINNKTENEGQFVQSDDLFIVSNSKIETEFGQSKHDVMEVSVYDINNNLLPQQSGNNVAYIQMGDIKNYMYQITNKTGLKELAIDVEKLLSDLGFTNGILKVNINFVRNRVGTENESTRVWIQEVSPSREEIRILPLKTKDNSINLINKNQFANLKNLNKDFVYNKKAILDSLNSFENNFLSKIDDILINQFGNDFFVTIKKDFGLSNFDKLKNKIFNDFKQSTTYYLTNKYYNLGESNFGAPGFNRFDDYEIYDYNTITAEIQNILHSSIDINLKSLKRRDVDVDTLPKEFSIVELKKKIKDNLDSFKTFSETKRNVYSPDGKVTEFDDINTGEPKYPIVGTLLSTFCAGYDQYGNYADGNGGKIAKVIELNSPMCGYVAPGGGGTGGGGSNGGGGKSGGGTGGGSNDNVVPGPNWQQYQK